MSLWTTLYGYLPTCLCLHSITNCIWPQDDTIYSQVPNKEVIAPLQPRSSPPDVQTMSTQPFVYRRVNHFNEFLAQFHEVDTKVPRRIVKEVIAHYQQRGNNELCKITRQDIKLCLRETKNQRYYEHINAIRGVITGQQMPVMPHLVEEELKQRFQAIQKPFKKHCPSSRTSFFNYSYVIRKLLQLMRQETYLPLFPQLKSKYKLIACDQIWKGICNELGWEFHPAITYEDAVPMNDTGVEFDSDEIVEFDSDEIVEFNSDQIVEDPSDQIVII